MELHGNNIIGSAVSGEGSKTFLAFDPAAGKQLETPFREATAAEVAKAMDLAAKAAPELAKLSAEQTADFLLAVKEEIAALGDALIEKASQESGLDMGRLQGERMRTLNQIGLFADVVKEGSWVDARIDTALPDRKPLPRPDLRRMLQPVGPIAVFGASNFPLAFSVAGGDTASAFAARNPVVVKAHPAHPGTSEMVAQAIARAVKAKGLPEGTFSMIHSLSPEMSLALVTNPNTKAVAFTGSQRAGLALYHAAANRPDPIPVFAEMGSVNPVVVLPDTLAKNAKGIAEGLQKSVVLGVGQFCTSPGLVFAIDGPGFKDFYEELKKQFEGATPGTMLNPSISKNFTDRFNHVKGLGGVQSFVSSKAPDSSNTQGQPGLLVTDLQTWAKSKDLHEEIFGPATVLVKCASKEELLAATDAFEGTLTATIHGTAEELVQHGELIQKLAAKAGRLIFNGYPTGVEVSPAMHHGGPFPSTADSKFTSVGTAAIYRFARPVCYQNFPEGLLPVELQNANPRKIWRMVNGETTKDGIG